MPAESGAQAIWLGRAKAWLRSSTQALSAVLLRGDGACRMSRKCDRPRWRRAFASPTI